MEWSQVIKMNNRNSLKIENFKGILNKIKLHERKVKNFKENSIFGLKILVNLKRKKILHFMLDLEKYFDKLKMIRKKYEKEYFYFRMQGAIHEHFNTKA